LNILQKKITIVTSSESKRKIAD